MLCMVLTQVMRERAEAGYLLDAGHNLQLLAAAKLQVAVALVHAHHLHHVAEACVP